VVIVGGGFGGAYCARALERRLGRDGQVTLIDRHDYLVFHPLLIEAGTGSIEPRHAIVPVRDLLRRTTFRMAEVTGIDLERRVVMHRLVGSPHLVEAPYDDLVLAPGSVTRLPTEDAVPGVRRLALELKNLADAVALRDRAMERMELASAIDDPHERRALLHMVVVGGNFTGVELAGEFHEFLQRAARRCGVDPREVGMTLLELSDRILAPLGKDLSDFAATHLRRRGIDVRLRTTVKAMHAGGVTLDTGEDVVASTCVWCAGIEPSPLVAALGLPVDERGYIACDRDLRVIGHENVWAIGDAAVNPDAQGRAYPATAQHATRQGVHCARNVVAVSRGEATTPCDLASLGSLAAIGCRTGVAKVFGLRVAGFPAWWLWRTVYLLKMPGLARKVRVALDWTIDLVFSRDYVQLGVHTRGATRSDDGNR
jgi:NADH dehydrogenase